MKQSLAALLFCSIVVGTVVMVSDALVQNYPDGKCRNYANVNSPNCDAQNAGNCCPNPCNSTAD